MIPAQLVWLSLHPCLKVPLSLNSTAFFGLETPGTQASCWQTISLWPCRDNKNPWIVENVPERGPVSSCCCCFQPLRSTKVAGFAPTIPSEVKSAAASFPNHHHDYHGRSSHMGVREFHVVGFSCAIPLSGSDRRRTPLLSRCLAALCWPQRGPARASFMLWTFPDQTDRTQSGAKVKYNYWTPLILISFGSGALWSSLLLHIRWLEKEYFYFITN